MLKPQGFHFRKQVPFRDYVLDFVEHSTRVVIELDGRQHGEEMNRPRDARRDELLRSESYHVLRFWNYEVVEDIGAVVDLIYRTARDRLSPARSASPSLCDATADR